MNDQAENLRRRLENDGEIEEGKTIAVVSGKGGVGKSNTALNFSLGLQEKGKKVLLFDLDVGMGNIDILLGIQTKYTIVDMFNKSMNIHDIIEVGPKGLSYIAGGTGLNDFFTLDQAKINYFYEQYNKLVKMFDYILFDLGAGASNDSMVFVLAADECLVVTTPEPTAITDAYSMIKFIVKERPNMPILVIMNRSLNQKDGRQALQRFENVIQQFLNRKVRKIGILPDDQLVSTAVIRQTPYLLLDGRAAISRAIRLIVQNYLTNSDELDSESKEPFSFVRKLKRFFTMRSFK